MTDKQINKWLRRQFTVVGWALIGYYVLMNLLATLAMGVEAINQAVAGMLQGWEPQIDMNAVAGNAWGYIAASLAALAILHAWKGTDYWREEMLAKRQRMLPRDFFCLLSLCIGAQMVNSLWITVLELGMNAFGRSVMTTLESVAGAADTFSMFLYASIVAPIGEELIFRGYILRSLQPYGKRFAIFGSALLFGLFHGNLLQAPYAFLVGLVLGYVTVEYSVLWAIAIHVFNNLVLADLLTRLTMHWPEMAAGMLNLLVFGGFLLLSIRILIAKRWEIRVYRNSEWMDRRVLTCFFTNSGMIILTVMMVLNMILILFL